MLEFELEIEIVGGTKSHYTATETEVTAGGAPDIHELMAQSGFWQLPAKVRSHDPRPFSIQILTIRDGDQHHTVNIDSEASAYTPLQAIINVVSSIGAKKLRLDQRPEHLH